VLTLVRTLLLEIAQWLVQRYSKSLAKWLIRGSTIQEPCQVMVSYSTYKTTLMFQ